jgi:hypothetical protein
MSAYLRCNPADIPAQWLYWPQFRLWPPMTHRATLWCLAQMVACRSAHGSRQDPCDLFDFLQRARWILYAQPRRRELVGNYLCVLDEWFWEGFFPRLSMNCVHWSRKVDLTREDVLLLCFLIEQGALTFGYSQLYVFLGLCNKWLAPKKIPVGARFFAHFQNDPGAHPASSTMGTGFFPGVTRPGRGADHPPPPSAEVENEWSYNFTPPSGPGWPVIGWPYIFTYCNPLSQTKSHFIPSRLWRWNWQSVPKRRYLNYRHRGITQKKGYDRHNLLRNQCVHKYEEAYQNINILSQCGTVFMVRCT